MPAEWVMSVVIPIFKGNIYRNVKLLQHTMNIVMKVLDKNLSKIVMIDDMQFSFLPGKSTIHAVFILRKFQVEYLPNQKKLHMSL